LGHTLLFVFASIDIGNVFVFPSRIPNMKDWSFEGLDVTVGSSSKEQRDSDITARGRAFEQGTGHEGCMRLDLTSDKTSGGLDDECPACLLVMFHAYDAL
jgi:hypothetical protein